MVKLFISIVCFVVILSMCNGCSFIKERFSNTQQTPKDQNNEQQQERQQEPIPVSPQHS